jgi:methyl-accepting chemotaxis protein
VSIRNKLVAIVAALVAAFGVSIGLYFVILAPVNEIETESLVLSGLKKSMYDLEIHSSRLLSARDFSEAIATLGEREKDLAAGFAALKDLKVLPKADKAIGESLDAIKRLNELIEGTERDLDSILASTLEALAKDSQGGKSRQLWSVLRTGSFSSSDVQVLNFRAGQMIASVDYLSLALDTSIDVINKQSRTIDEQIAKIRTRSVLVALAAMILVLGSVVFITLRIGRGIAKRVGSIEGVIGSMKEGDLTLDVAEGGSDEIGALSSDLNLLSRNLRSSIAKVQAVSEENISMKDTLIATAEESLSAAQQISSNGESIGRRIETLNLNLGDATGDVEAIGESISALEGRIRDQMSMVEESTASVTEMIASISNVAKIADQRREAIDKLVVTVAAGGEKLAETSGEIARITESVADIKDITGIIANLSSQTNLLAMNAAIEAAHAGESGRGFSVVADEIRKLAEASSANSKEIGVILKDIIDRVDSVSRSGDESNRAFKSIEAEVEALRNSLIAIFSNMSELHVGGGQILQAITSLRDASVAVKDDSTQIGQSASSINESMNDLRRVSTDVASGISEISTGTKEISTAMKDVLQNAGRVGSLGESLNAELSGFKTA